MPRFTQRITLSLFFLSLATGLPAEEWTQWGGPDRNFYASRSQLAPSWPDSGPSVLWSHSLAGGYAGVLVDSEQVYVATRRENRDLVQALDKSDGRVVWEYQTEEAPPFESQVVEFGVGPNATPLLHDGKLFLVGFTGRFHALDAQTGKLLWSHDLVKDFGAKVHRFGYSNSPIVHGGQVLLLLGGDKAGAIGFDPESGEARWRTPPIDTSYSAPMIFTIGGQEQLVFMGPEEVVGTNLSDGSVSWRHPHKNRFSNNCAGPWWDGESLLFVSSQADGGAKTLRLSTSEQGVAVQEIASSKKVKIFHSNGLRVGQHLYASYDQFLAGHDLRTGETLWKERGFPGANLIQAENRTLALDENGILSLLTLSAEGVEVHSKHQVLSKPSWTPPTLVGSRLYARDKEKLVAIELGSGSASSGAAQGQ